MIEYVKDTFPYSFSFFHRNGEIPVDFPDPENACGGNSFFCVSPGSFKFVIYLSKTGLEVKN